MWTFYNFTFEETTVLHTKGTLYSVSHQDLLRSGRYSIPDSVPEHHVSHPRGADCGCTLWLYWAASRSWTRGLIKLKKDLRVSGLSNTGPAVISSFYLFFSGRPEETPPPALRPDVRVVRLLFHPLSWSQRDDAVRLKHSSQSRSRKDLWVWPKSLSQKQINDRRLITSTVPAGFCDACTVSKTGGVSTGVKTPGTKHPQSEATSSNVWFCPTNAPTHRKYNAAPAVN